MDWIKGNYSWFFSGAGVFFVGLIIAYVKRKKNSEENHQTSDVKNAFKNDVKAKNVQINQTFFSVSKTGDASTKNDDVDNKSKAPELKKIKDDYFGQKNKTRTFIIEILAKARHENSILEVRHVTDKGEVELGLNHQDTVNELEKIEEEGLIKFEITLNEQINPYTRIKLTEKYFEII